jgi:DtxR family transcriptional regulator, Mn-dependent transcriptional regulator
MLNENVEDYLKAIYGISSNEFVSTNDIAEKLGYSPSNVSKMLKKLAESELVEYISHQGVKLTESGIRESLRILRRHRLLEMFLFKTLGYKWDEIHDEACILEHHISGKFENAIDEFLGFPTRDPHGDPIPDKNGNMMSYNVVPLSEVEIGISVRIFRILGNNSELLKYLADLNLLPDTILKLLKKEPFAGSMIIECNDVEKMLGLDAAKLILVEIEN